MNLGHVLDYLFGAASFVPHGYCLLWRPDLVALHAISDVLIASAYFSIPAAILLFVRRRHDLELGWVPYLFVAFIFLCGTTHLIGGVSLWYPYYGIEGLVKLVTATVSLGTAIILWPILPKALAVPSPAQWRSAAERLAAEVDQRIDAQEQLRESNLTLERRVAARTQELAEANRRLRDRERELERQTLLLTTIFETMEQGITVFDSDMRLVLWNQRFAQYVDLPADLLHEGLPLREIFRFQAEEGRLGDGDVDTLVEQQWQKICGDQLLTYERRHQHDGRVIDIWRHPFPLGGVVGTFTDVTERHIAEERFRMAVEASPSGMIMIDQGGRVIMVNQEAENLFGYRSDELIGQPVERLVPEAFRAAHADHRRDYMLRPEKRRMGDGRDLHAQHKDGRSFLVEIGLNPIQGRGESVVLAAIIDVTERRRAEDALARQTAELKRSNAELEQFAYIASHDLREPLRMVASYTELLAERYRGRLDERADKYINYAIEGARRMQSLVSDLLKYSHVGSQPKPLTATDVGTLLRRIIGEMSPAIEESGAEITMGDLPVVYADEFQLGQVFQNLIANAVKFRAEDRPCKISIEAEARHGMWTFSVTDNGIGIETQYADRIFQMFQRLHERGKYEGSGIGLAICKKIVEQHGGEIWFTSEPNQRTTFSFSLPQRARTTLS